ncbi:hypothetical protein CRG98_021271 [Punica granatum]|uniref:SKP1 component POZ domain-containing protein n=1 Tax=Punica granatum TaxID=22663 RepID=A0A2I0JR00_PUNGR|nr:hypothetical protein CRG98_021271 [Punica granatum]
MKGNINVLLRLACSHARFLCLRGTQLPSPDRSQTIRHMIEYDCADNGIPLPNVTSKILAKTIRHMIEYDCADNGIPLPNVTSKILAKVVEYCKKHFIIVLVIDNYSMLDERN